jgi:hypothetical protein
MSGAYRQQSSPVAAPAEAGPVVTLFARWVLIGAGILVALWSPNEQDLTALKITLAALFGLAIGNFALHAQVLRGRPLSAGVLYTSSAVDIGVVTLIILVFRAGIEDPAFVFYYPALLALALVFPTRVTISFVTVLLCLYSAVAVVSVSIAEDGQVFVARTISLLAMAVIGATYRNVEQRRLEHQTRTDAAFTPGLTRARG